MRSDEIRGRYPQQVIVEWLTNPPALHAERRARHGMIADVKTIQFLKANCLPRLQLHTVQFVTSVGTRRLETCLLVLDIGGIWKWEGSSGKMLDDPRVIAYRDQQSKLGQPIAILGGSFPPFTAHGEVVDNGFSVTRVQLVSQDGQVLEDEVQDGLIQFLTDQPYPTPIRVHFYNQQGERVGTQLYPPSESTEG